MKKSILNTTTLLYSLLFLHIGCNDVTAKKEVVPVKTNIAVENDTPAEKNMEQPKTGYATIDTADYTQRMRKLSNGDSSGKWPGKIVYPLPGAILPYNRIVAFYGNLYSTRMGILGELPRAQMIAKLQEEAERWRLADSTIPVIPALHYIAITAQGAAGKDSKHRLRMPHHQIDTILQCANPIHALVFFDLQV